jgi:hypothetical protein
MPQTVEEWERLASLYESALFRSDKEISRLKIRINRLEQKTKPQWISVKDRLPSPAEPVLVSTDSGDIDLYDGCKDWVVSEVFDAWDVTHWQPLPPPPGD